MKEYDLSIFDEGLKSLDIHLDTNQISQFMKYYEILIEWNKVMNLTGIIEFEDVIKKHFLDSLALVKAIDIQSVVTLIDIGTGAGFPGIPLKIAFPHLDITLLDSLNKRIKFLDEVISMLDLNHIKAIHGRAEEYVRAEKKREHYDLCVSRAVSNLSTLSEYCVPYVKEGGYFISYKSGQVEEEVSQSGKVIHMLGGKMEEEIRFNIPGSDILRTLIKIKKMGNSPKRFPRKDGLPAKEPIG